MVSNVLELYLEKLDKLVHEIHDDTELGKQIRELVKSNQADIDRLLKKTKYVERL
jgi:hypothetical protein